MPETTHLTVLDAEALHAFVSERTGDAPAALRDRGQLESAVMLPQMAAHYASADLVQQAALLALGISQAQAFVDGNKRTGFIATDVFLRANGCQFTGDPLEMAKQLEAVSGRSVSEEEATTIFTEWLRAHVECLPENFESRA